MKRLALLLAPLACLLAIGCAPERGPQVERSALPEGTENDRSANAAAAEASAAPPVESASRPETPRAEESPVSEDDEPAAFLSLESPPIHDPPSILVLVEKPTDAEPVQAGAGIVPSPAAPGDAVDLLVRVSIADGWHIYAEDAGEGPYIPTRLTLHLPEGFALEGAGESSEADLVPTPQGMTRQHREGLRFRRTIRVSEGAAPGDYEIAGELRYQACDRDQCLPPATLPVKASLRVTPRSDELSEP